MIKRCLIAALLLVLLTAVSSAQSLGLGMGIPKSVPSAGGYVGIGDLSLTGGPISWYYGGSCYKASYSGNVADVYSTTNSQIMATLACSSGSIVATTGNCPGTPNACWSLATVKSTCVTLSACTASTIYEQSGASGNPGNMTPITSNATAAVLVYANGTSTCGNGSGTYLKSGNFCFYGDGSAVGMFSGNQTQTYAQPISIDVVSMPISSPGSALLFTGVGCSANDGNGLYYNSGFFTYAQTAFPSLGGSLNNWYAVIGAALNGSSSSVSLNDGTPVTTNPGTAGFVDCILDFFDDHNVGFTFYNGYVAEFIAFGTTALNSTDVTNIFNNDVTRLGGGL